jgi:hypothetical protein
VPNLGCCGAVREEPVVVDYTLDDWRLQRCTVDSQVTACDALVCPQWRARVGWR